MKKTLFIFALLLGITTIVSAQSRSSRTRAHSTKQKVQKKKRVPTPHSVSSTKGRKSNITKQSFAPVKITDRETSFKKEDALGIDFANNRGRMNWPVEGTISIPFGVYTIDQTNIKGNNPGITISTDDVNEPVKSVFDGVVCNVENGDVATIYIRHGKYYTVYSNLSAIHVKKGEVVKAGDTIGEVGEAYGTSGGELTFLLMNDTKNVNPVPWLSN